MPNQPDSPLRCHVCGSERKKTGKRLPRGWKRTDEQYICGSCWSASRVLRAVTMPVVEPIDVSWEQLDKVLKEMFRETTRASNWMMTQLYAQDVRRNGQDKMPPMPRAYLYPQARVQFPTLPPQTIASLEQAIQRKYKAARYKVVWTCMASLPTLRYPQPFPVHNQSWTPTIIDDRPHVSVRIGDRRMTLRLKGGSRFRRQLSAFRQMCKGTATTGELALYRSGKNLICKMVAWLPRPSVEREREGTLYVRTASDALLIACNGKDEAIWRWNASQIRQWAAEHRKRLQQWSEDQKAEQRPIPAFAEARKQASLIYRRRMDTAVKQAAAYIANYAERRHFAAVEYNDSERAYCPEFAWFALKDRLKIALDERKIDFVVSSPVTADSGGLLAQDVTDE